ncbi:MAG: hypothetical protein MJZ41_05130 [Bacteroidaceae bacterium]|nr:hypothetical protein [Bacteroidaceae bacterium]
MKEKKTFWGRILEHFVYTDAYDNISKKLDSIEDRLHSIKVSNNEPPVTIDLSEICRTSDVRGLKTEVVKKLAELQVSLEQKIDDATIKMSPNDSGEPQGEGSPQISSDYVNKLHHQLESLQGDACLFLMRKYVIDSQIELYKRIAYRLCDLKSDRELQGLISFLKTQLSTIGVQYIETPTGSEFSGKTMQVASGEKRTQLTNDKSLDGKVATTVVPRFIWTLPTSQGKSSVLLSKEEVILWEYTSMQIVSHHEESVNIQPSYTMGMSPQQTACPVGVTDIVGYLTLQIDNEIDGVFPVFKGHNIFGTQPQSGEQNVKVHQINIINSELKSMHFEINADGDSVITNVCDGATWDVNYRGNHPREAELCPADVIMIGNLKFTYIEK